MPRRWRRPHRDTCRAARGQRAVGPLRRSDRHRRPEPGGAGGRGPFAHRPERRRQDDRLQRDHGVSRAERGRDRLPRHAPERAEAEPDRRAGAGAHLPEDERLRRAQRAGERPDRPAPALDSRQPLAILLGLPSVAREGARARGAGARASSSSSASQRARASWAARFPTATSACSKSRSRSPRGRSSCCWTSRCPA